MITQSPAEVIAALLVQRGLATRPASAGSWPVTTSSMPDDLPDNRITVYAPSSENDGKDMRTGETYLRPDVQIRVRSVPASLGMKKLLEILNNILPLKGHDVTTNESVVITILNIMLVSGPAHMGQEEKNQRQHHVANVRLVLAPGA